MADISTSSPDLLRIKQLDRDILGQQFQAAQKEVAIDEKLAEIDRVRAELVAHHTNVDTLSAQRDAIKARVLAESAEPTAP